MQTSKAPDPELGHSNHVYFWSVLFLFPPTSFLIPFILHVVISFARTVDFSPYCTVLFPERSAVIVAVAIF